MKDWSKIAVLADRFKACLILTTLLLFGAGFPSWGQGQTSVPALQYDADGWIVFKAVPNSRTIYVSSSTGNDRNMGRSPESPLATIAAGKALLRNGHPDQLLLKAGDTFVDQSFGYLNVSGRSAIAPMIVGTFGNGPAPVIETNPATSGGTAIGSLPGKGGNFLVVQGLDFYAYKRDPGNPAFAGPDTTEQGANFLNPDTWVLLQGNRFRFYSTNVIFNSSNSSTVTSSEVMLYRNVITDSWSATSHSQGLYAAGLSNLLIIQNIFDHNGWNSSIPGAHPTIFNRNVYIQFNNKLIQFVENISARSSSEGAQFRSGGTISNNLFIADSAGFDVGHLEGEPTTTYSSATGNVILYSTDIQSSSGPLPRSQGIHVYNASGPEVQISNNIIAYASGSTINQGGIILDATTKSVTATNNIIYNVANPILDRGLGNLTSPNSVSDDPATYMDPTRALDSKKSIGQPESLTAFLEGVRKQDMANWRSQYSVTAIIEFIKAGFGSASSRN